MSHRQAVNNFEWKSDFVPDLSAGIKRAPKGWALKRKPGTRPAVFYVKTGPESKFAFLHMESDKGSSSLVTAIDGVDLKRTPFMRWRWRVTALPTGADGRIKAKDDQAIGIYIGAGTALNNKSVSYRWETETPKGTEGSSAYGFGSIKVKWHTLRNKADAAEGRWFTETRNVAEDFYKAWGFYPDKIALSVSCNSQYTSSRAAADLEWVEFSSVSNNKTI